MRSFVHLVGLGLWTGCTPVPDMPTPVSVAELRDHPERYEGQEVVLEAYIDLCWEGGWLSETESDWQVSPQPKGTPKGIRVQPSTRIDADSYDGTFGRVYGLVLSNRKPWHPVLGVAHVLPWGRFRERFEPKDFTGTTVEFLELHPEVLRPLLVPTEAFVGPPLLLGD